MGETHSAKDGGSVCAQLPYPPAPGTVPFQHLHVFLSPEATWTCYSGIFMEVSLHRYSWFYHWALVIELNVQLPSLPWKLVVGGVGVESFSPLTLVWSFWWPVPIWELSSPFPTSISKAISSAYEDSNVQKFKEFVPGTGDKEQVFILYYTTHILISFRVICHTETEYILF